MSVGVLLKRGLPALAGAWVFAGSVLWTSGGVTSRAATLATTAALMGLGWMVWSWATSGSALPPRGPARWMLDVALAALFSLALVGVGYGVEALAVEQAVRSVLSRSRLLPLEIALWMWLYGLLVAAGRGVRLRRDLDRARNAEALARAAEASARLAALQAQLNPHFLFNTLHDLASLTRTDPAGAEDAIEKLGDLLRYALDDGAGSRVTVERELEFTRNYLALARLARGNRLHVELSTEGPLASALVPPFAVQTLVENAIRHGVDSTPEGGAVRIRLSADADTVRVIVENERATNAAGHGLGVGVENLRSRLAVLYGGTGSLTLADTGNGRVRATLTVPSS